MKETIADVSSASPSSERMRGLWVNGVKKGIKEETDLSWSSHVNAIVNKANEVVGLLKRTVGSNNKEIFSMLYKSLVRPILEYTCPVWSPYLVKDKLAIVKVQRRASRIALGQKLREMPYEERCILLNWNTLQHRREYLSVVECYKTVFGLNGLDFDDYFEFCRSKNTRVNHPYKIQTKLAKVNSFKYSFFVRIIKDWNSLPNHLFTRGSVSRVNIINRNAYGSTSFVCEKEN